MRIDVAPAAAAATPPESQELKDLRQAMLDLQSKIDGIGPTEPDAETQKLMRDMLHQNEKLAQDLLEVEKKYQRDLATARELMEVELDRKLMALKAELAAAAAEIPAPIPAATPAFDLEAQRAEEERLRLQREEENRLRAEEAARKAELEKRREEALELAKAQISSPAVIFDEGGVLGGAPVNAGEPSLPACPSG